MNKNLFYSKILSACVLLTGLFSVTTIVQYHTGLPVDNTTVFWLFEVLFIFIIFCSIKCFVDNKQFVLMQFITLYLIFVLLNVIRGIWIADGYWDFKGLITNALALLVPLFAYLGTNKKLMTNILSYFFKYGLVLFILLLPILPNVSYGYYLVPIAFIALFFSALSFRTKILVFFFTIVVITADLSARSNVIKFFVPVLLGCTYYFRFLITQKILNSVRLALFVLPIILLSLAVTDTFNVFKMDEYISTSLSGTSIDKDGNAFDENLLSDTRTFLYVEALYTADYYDSWLFGRSPTRGTLSAWFGHEDMNNRGERLRSEVSILNIFTWLGIIGLALYGLIFYQASLLAVTQSNNYYCKIMGVFVAFRWSYSWVEEFTLFSLTSLLLWIMIGMCYSQQFREMNDSEFISWVRGLFTRVIIK